MTVSGTAGDNEWQRVTANDNEWPRKTARGKTNENKWEQVKQCNFKFQNERKGKSSSNFVQIFIQCITVTHPAI